VHRADNQVAHASRVLAMCPSLPGLSCSREPE
jgi:hypothetical protein